MAMSGRRSVNRMKSTPGPASRNNGDGRGRISLLPEAHAGRLRPADGNGLADLDFLIARRRAGGDLAAVVHAHNIICGLALEDDVAQAARKPIAIIEYAARSRFDLDI